MAATLESYNSAIGPIAWSHDDASLTILMAGREHLLQWADISGAGVTDLPTGEGSETATFLLITPGIEFDYLLRMPLPAGEPVAEELAATVQDYIGDRWYSDLTSTNYRQRLMPNPGAPPAWVVPAIILAFIGLSALMLFGCLLVTMIREGAWDILSWQVVGGFVLWLVIVAGALFVYRRVWFKN